MGKGSADTRTPDHRKRRDNYDAIDWRRKEICRIERKFYEDNLGTMEERHNDERLKDGGNCVTLGGGGHKHVSNKRTAGE